MKRRISHSTSYQLSAISLRQGFTLIEIIVVVAIMGLLMGGSIAGYRAFNQRQIVQTTAKELLVNMRQAQSKATSGIKGNAGCNNQTLLGYRVQSTGGNRYTISLACQAGVTLSYYALSTVNIATGALLESNFDVTFLGQSGGVRSASALPLTIHVKPSSQTANCNSAQNACYDISVNKTGSVEDLGF